MQNDVSSRVGGRPPKPAAERMDRLCTLEPNSGCWLWLGAMYPNGYGCIHVNGKTRPAHRVSYEIHKGPIPAGLVLDHLCRIPTCINPDHLEAVTQKENVKRGLSSTGPRANKTHCIRGHLLPERKYCKSADYFHRPCRKCRAMSDQRRSHKRKYKLTDGVAHHD